MDSELKKLLEENLVLNKENNKMLIQLVRFQRWTQITKIAYWVIIIGMAAGIFYFVKPLLNNLANIYTGGVSGLTDMSDVTKSLSDKQQIKDLINDLNR